MSIFGWSLPPGCGTLPGEEPDPPCEVCGNDVDSCICPVCPQCGEQGNPQCYIEDPDGEHFAMVRTQEQIESLAENQRKWDGEDEPSETDPYGDLEFAVGSGDDFHCFAFHVHANGDVTLHSVVNSETGSFIMDAAHPFRVKAGEAVKCALGLIDQALEWCHWNEVRHSKKGWNQDPYYFARAVAMAVDQHNGKPYKRVARKNGKVPATE